MTYHPPKPKRISIGLSSGHQRRVMRWVDTVSILLKFTFEHRFSYKEMVVLVCVECLFNYDACPKLKGNW